AERLLVRARAFVSLYTVELEPGQAALTVDGAPAVLRDAQIMLDPGLHTLAAQASGFQSEQQLLHVDAGEKGKLHITLQPLALAPQTSMPAPEPSPVRRSEEPP